MWTIDCDHKSCLWDEMVGAKAINQHFVHKRVKQQER